MSDAFASGRNAYGFCDLCSFRYPLKDLKKLVVKLKETSTRACPACWTPDHPQLQVGMYPVHDPQALRDPRPDNSLAASRVLPADLNLASVDQSGPVVVVVPT